MPIDEGLKNLPKSEQGDIFKKPEEVIESTYDVKEMMDSYIDSMSEGRDFNKHIVKNFTDYIRFGKGLEPIILPIPKEEFLKIISKDSPDLQYVVDHTDIINNIPDFINIETTYNDLFYDTDLCDTGDDLEYVKEFNEDGKNIFIIPNIEFLSLFLEHGAKLRKYQEVTKIDNDGDILKITTNQDKRLELELPYQMFQVKHLKKFCEETKITKITDLTNELKKLKEYVENTSIEYKGELSKLKSNLFERLQKYSPDMIYVVGDKDAN
jgi:hypothetical protein